MKNSEKEISNIDYSLAPFKSKRFIALYIFIFIFIIGGKLKDSFSLLQGNSFKLNPSCTIQYSGPEVSFFLPKVTFKEIHIPSSCSKNAVKTIKISNPVIHFNLLSFSPFGLKFLIEAKALKQNLEIGVVAGLSTLSILMEQENSINSIKLRDFSDLTSPVALDGDLLLSTVFASLSYKGALEDFAANIASENIVIPEQNIMGFNLNVMNLNKLLIQVNMINNRKLHLKKFILGDDKSPIITQFAGEIDINQRNPKLSGLQLAGELKLSDKLLSDISLLEGLLSRFDKKDKYYQIKIDGTVTNPKFDSKR